MGIIKYKRAKTGNDEIVNIEEVSLEMRKSTRFTCISCGQELSACLGSKNQHHFRHKTEVDCNLETYLHKMGKYTFVKTYKECLSQGKPFTITLNRKISCQKESTCKVKPFLNRWEECCDYRPKTFDLTRYYDSVAEEQAIGSFVADILLTSSKGYPPTLVEIKVSHPCEETKIQSGFRIIEIGLTKEEDLDLIASCRLVDPVGDNTYLETIGQGSRRKKKDEEPTVRCYNFREAPKELFDFHKIYQFGIYRNNPSHFCLNETVSCGEKEKLINRHRRGNQLLYEILFYKENWGPGRFIFGVARAYEKGFKIKNCFLCRYHAYNENRLTPEEDKPIFCKLYKKLQTKPQCHSTQAIECSAFVPDKRAYANYLLYAGGYEEIVY